MLRIKYWAIALLCTSIIVSCTESKKDNKETDTPTSGHLVLSVDETFRPVIEEEIKVYKSNFPKADISAAYKPEAQAIKDFLEGKTKLIIVSRTLSEEENNYCLAKKIVPSSLALAKDAVALVVNKNSKDTLFSKTQLQGILSGNYSKKYQVVFDNEGSSTLRYMKDSLLKGQNLAKEIYAAKSNEAVIQYVQQNPNAIGFVGLSYISDTMDSTLENFNTDIKVAAIYNDSLGQFYQPYQADIALKHYPLVRKMYYIKNETYQGIATGFSNFMAFDKGQLILGKERLVPMRMSIVIRDAAINPSDEQ